MVCPNSYTKLFCRENYTDVCILNSKICGKFSHRSLPLYLCMWFFSRGRGGANLLPLKSIIKWGCLDYGLPPSLNISRNNADCTAGMNIQSRKPGMKFYTIHNTSPTETQTEPLTPSLSERHYTHIQWDNNASSRIPTMHTPTQIPHFLGIWV